MFVTYLNLGCLGDTHRRPIARGQEGIDSSILIQCGHLAGKVIVPFQDQINRLIATRLQWDIMGVSNILIARTDSESGKLLSSNIDPRDHEFLLGVADVEANNIKAQSQLLYELELSGASVADINAAELEWTQKHPLITFAQGTLIPFPSNMQPSNKKSVSPLHSTTLPPPSTENPSLKPANSPKNTFPST